MLPLWPIPSLPDAQFGFYPCWIAVIARKQKSILLEAEQPNQTLLFTVVVELPNARIEDALSPSIGMEFSEHAIRPYGWYLPWAAEAVVQVEGRTSFETRSLGVKNSGV